MPSGGMAEAGRVIENGDTEMFAVHRSVVITPLRGLAPGSLVAIAFAVDDMPLLS